MFENIERIKTLPLDLKSKYIIELRKQGYTYKQIAKLLRVSTRDIARVLKKEFRKDEIEELKERVERLERIIESIKRFGSSCRSHCSYFDGNMCLIFHKNPNPLECAVCKFFERKFEMKLEER